MKKIMLFLAAWTNVSEKKTDCFNSTVPDWSLVKNICKTEYEIGKMGHYMLPNYWKEKTCSSFRGCTIHWKVGEVGASQEKRKVSYLLNILFCFLFVLRRLLRGKDCIDFFVFFNFFY
jgi:hypothetical protein